MARIIIVVGVACWIIACLVPVLATWIYSIGPEWLGIGNGVGICFSAFLATLAMFVLRGVLVSLGVDLAEESREQSDAS